MSISRAIKRAYRTKEARGWDTVYWAIDLHGVCLKSNYHQGGYEWINNEVIEGLRAISARPESKIILWSSMYGVDALDVMGFFHEHGIRVDWFNCNPDEPSNQVSNFSEKFYFSILLDDKAGFDPDKDWAAITKLLKVLK